jgi:hypothetical protein
MTQASYAHMNKKRKKKVTLVQDHPVIGNLILQLREIRLELYTDVNSLYEVIYTIE